METKSSLSQIKNIVESHSSRLEQVEDRISGLEDKINIKEKNRRILRQKTEKLQKNSATPSEDLT
jgi:chaperonin cofactor prefoldin